MSEEQGQQHKTTAPALSDTNERYHFQSDAVSGVTGPPPIRVRLSVEAKQTTELFAPSLADQIAELERELTLRHRVYPEFVRAKRLSDAKAARQIACLMAAIEALQRVANG